jgi:hypothetical protein
MANKLEFKITKDLNNKDIDLKSMSLAASKSFLILLESLTKIIELTPNSKGIKIQIIEGSATAAAIGTASQINDVETEFNDIVNHKSSNKEIVEKWGSLQELFTKNGLQYEANFYKNSKKTSVLETIKSARKFTPKIKRKRRRSDTNLLFMSGRLIEVGGKKPNIHLLDSSDNRYTINCNEINAKRANRYLYEPINISTWAKIKEGYKSHYEFCDVYGNVETFNDFKEFMADYYLDDDEISSLKKLHYKCKSFLDVQDFGSLRKFMKLFNHPIAEPNALKTILVITSDFKDNDRISGVRQGLKALLDEKIYTHKRNNSSPF